MSLFIDVIETLSDSVKSSLIQVLNQQRKDYERVIRKLCDTCIKYMDYGELQYFKMEEGIRDIQKLDKSQDPLIVLLMAILNESLDEDALAVKFFTESADNSLTKPFQKELHDFILLGRFITLKEYDLLENAGNLLIDKYTDEHTITDVLSNLYLKLESEMYIPVFQKLAMKAKEKYPESLAVESLTGFMYLKGMDYQKALESFLIMKDRLEPNSEDQNYHSNLASTWDHIAGCYLKMGDPDKTIESCDQAIMHDAAAEPYKVGYPPLYKKAEALLMKGRGDEALAIVNDILKEDEEDEKAQEIRSRITG